MVALPVVALPVVGLPVVGLLDVVLLAAVAHLPVKPSSIAVVQVNLIRPAAAVAWSVNHAAHAVYSATVVAACLLFRDCSS